MVNKPVLGVLQDIDPEIFMGLFELRIIDREAPNFDWFSAVLFGGGTDVSPSLYKEPLGQHSSPPDERRDLFETEVYNHCVFCETPMIGICRGSQFLTVMAGGRLVQHVTNHAGRRHNIITLDNRIISANSYHHQMMLPYTAENAGYRVNVIAKTVENLSDVYLNGYDKPINSMEEEPEIVLYTHKTNPNYTILNEPRQRPNILCIQGHPEWDPPNSDFYKYTLELTQRHIIEKKGI